jgi:hypothetical protein
MDQISESMEASAFPKSESEVAPPQSAGASVTAAGVAAFEGISTRIGRYRWVIFARYFSLPPHSRRSALPRPAMSCTFHQTVFMVPR